MIERTARRLLTVIVVLLVASGSAAVWLLHTHSGASWLWSRIESARPDQLSAASVGGTLGGGLTLRQLVYRDAAQTVTVDRAVLSIDPDLIPTRLVIETLQLDDVVIEMSGLAPRQEDDTGIALDDVLASLALPFPVQIRQASVRRVSLQGSDGLRREFVTSLKVSGRWFESLDIGQLTLIAPGVTLDFAGGVELTPPFELKPETRMTARMDGVAGSTPPGATAALSGDLRSLRVDLRGANPAVTVHGTVAAIDPDPRFEMTVESPRLAWPLSGVPAVALENLQLQVQGRPSDYAVELQAEVLSEWSGRAQGSLQARGNLEQLQLETLELLSPELDAGVQGELRWAGSFAAEARVELRRLDPSRWIADWPQPSYVDGRIAGRYSDTRLELKHVQLQHSSSPASVGGSGVVDVGNGVVEAELAWNDLQWPLAPSAPTVDSRSGRLQLRGVPEDWSVSGDIALSAPDLPEGRFRLDGSGDLDSVQLSIADSDVLGGNVTGDLSLAWRESGAWSADLKAKDVTITPFAPQWPGRLSAEFTASGQRVPFALNLDIASLDGVLRSRPVRAAGRIAAAADILRADNLRIESGESRIALDGAYRERAGLSFDLAIASLGDVLPGAAGSLHAKGNVMAGNELPQLLLDLNAEDIGWQDLHIDTLQIRNSASADTPFALAADAGAVTVAGHTLDSLSMTLNGNRRQHRLELGSTLSASSANLVLEGGVDQLRSPRDARWDGRLAALYIRSGDRLSMNLQQPAALGLSAASATLNRACLDAGDGAVVCGSGSWSESGAFASVVELSAVPVDLMHLMTDSDLEFSQTLTGTIQVARVPRGKLSAGGRIDVSAGQIRNTLDERLTLKTRPGFARFALNDGSLLSGELSLPFSDTAEIAGAFRVVDIGRGPDSPVEGHITANVSDIGVGASIVPMIDEAGGRLNADIRIAGTLDAPLYSGTASLKDGLFTYDPLGVRIDDIELDSEIRNGNRIEIKSTFRAGNGRGEITTSADYLQGRQAGLELAFAGNNLTLINVPDLVVKADADLKIGLQNDDVSINGRIVLPEARLSSVNVTSGSVSESPDVEFVGDEVPPEEQLQETPSPLDFSGSVDLELGEQVVIDVDVAQARLRGSSTFTWRGPAMPRARGQYDVSGKFQAYGQLLEITEGSIRYPDVPADRPELRVRAEREIFGNSQVRRAGVLVTGTATRPVLEVYTTPATSEDRALTLLATGSDFDYEQGVGAVDVGRYIAPRLYASYGIGLFDKENVISVRYDLASGFGVKATSGKRTAGVDLSYTIEY